MLTGIQDGSRDCKHLLFEVGRGPLDLAVVGVARLSGTAEQITTLGTIIAGAARSAAGAAPVVRRLPSGVGDAPPLSLVDLATLPAQEPPMLLLALGAAPDELEHALLLRGARRDLVVLTDLPTPAAAAVLLAESDGSISVFHAAQADDEERLDERPPTVATLGRDRAVPVFVQVLGSVRITGIEGDLSRHPKLTELIAYLAVHPEGSLSRAWTGALWPERRVPQQTVANRLSEARRLLGFDADDLPRLRRDGERHQLRGVCTDWQRFRELAAADHGPSDWCDALALVRGRPFEDLQEGQWTVLEGFVSEIEDEIAATALRLGAHALQAEEPEQAVFAARQALRAAPFDERLHRLLMRAADQAGNRGAIEEVLQQLVLVLEIDGDPLVAVHPETAALYQALSGRARPVQRATR
jgi:DNA-binding SARP family transcriptional activator